MVLSVTAIPECHRETPLRDIPCIVYSSWKPADCTQYNVTVYNSTNATVQTATWQNSIPYCYFILNISKTGTYPWNSSINSGVYTITGGDDMASFTVIGSLLVLNLVIFLLPFFVKFGMFEGIKGEIIDYVTKRCIWVISGLFFWFNFLMIADIGIQQNLGIESGLRMLVNLFTLCLWILIGWLFFTMIKVPLKMWNQYMKKVRMGEIPN